MFWLAWFNYSDQIGRARMGWTEVRQVLPLGRLDGFRKSVFWWENYFLRVVLVFSCSLILWPPATVLWTIWSRGAGPLVNRFVNNLIQWYWASCQSLLILIDRLCFFLSGSPENKNIYSFSESPINTSSGIGRQCLRDHSDVRTIRRMCIRYFREILDRLY